MPMNKRQENARLVARVNGMMLMVSSVPLAVIAFGSASGPFEIGLVTVFMIALPLTGWLAYDWGRTQS